MNTPSGNLSSAISVQYAEVSEFPDNEKGFSVAPVPPHWIPLCPIVGRQHTSPAATTSTAAMAQEGTSARGVVGSANHVLRLLACGLDCLNPSACCSCTMMGHFWTAVIALGHLTHTHTHRSTPTGTRQWKTTKLRPFHCCCCVCWCTNEQSSPRGLAG